MRRPMFLKQLVLAATTAALASVMVVSVAAAQAPPNPPSRFVGNIVVDGAPATAGTLIEARIGSATCGATTVFMSGGEARYVLDSPAADPVGSPNCGADGSTVTFYVAGKQASQTGSWANYRLNTVNLTVSQAVATPTTAPATPVVTPAAPVAGNSGGGSSSPASVTELMLVAAALGLAGVGFASRVRKS
ncbi:MAG: hypothetical protein ABI577_16605 [bacterium]